ncbi:WhiB family transcriptional regulator [Brachybacterium phenoliresistens]|uniref:WhiB family transcriptional regulator n=1 Tax=Brachybacterium phenoliresistens TaxID=396014 RepID=UPI0031DAA5BC
MSKVDPLEWMDQALCREVDTGIFFPSKGGSTTAARKVCGSCPVRAECLELALQDTLDGIWGGTTPNERKAMRRKRAA